jgi:outer membrane protein TolC
MTTLQLQRKFLCLFTVTALLFCHAPFGAAESSSGPEHTLTITDCINMADHANPAIGLTIARLQEAEALVKEARSHLFPELKYDLNARRYSDDPGLEGYVDYEGKEQISAALSFSWPVYSWNRLTNHVKAEEHEKIARKWEILRGREKAIHQAIAAYWTLASTTEAKSYLGMTIHELKLFQETAQADLENSSPNALEKDVIQIEIEINKMQAWRGTLDRWFGTAGQGLAIAIGRPALRPVISDNIVRYKKLAISYNDCLTAAWQHRAELKASAERIKSAKLQIDINRKMNRPTLSLFGQGILSEDDYSPSQDSTGMIGLSLHGTIFDGFRQDAGTAKALARYKELQNEHRMLEDEIRQQVYSSYLKVKEAYRKLVRFRQARRATLEKLELVRSGYAMNVSDVEDVLETQVERRFRDRDYIFTKLNLILALNDLNLACGSRIYDFSRHVSKNRDQKPENREQKSDQKRRRENSDEG